MKNIAIITARSGSKGLPDKNILPLKGKPLMAYSIEAAIKSELFDTVHVSTDSKKYADIAMECGADVPFLRSEHNSTDISSSWDVVLEVLQKYKEKGKSFDTVCLLQPTSPLRTAENILEGYKLFDQKNADAVTSVCECEHSPLWCMTLETDLSLDEYRKMSESDVPRQKLKKFYRLNGALFIRRIIYGSEIRILHSNEYAYIMDRKQSVDIDTKEDFEYAEFIVGKS